MDLGLRGIPRIGPENTLVFLRITRQLPSGRRNTDIERQLSALELMNAGTIPRESTAEIMVQLWSSNSFCAF
jgi:hypothetical protein